MTKTLFYTNDSRAYVCLISHRNTMFFQKPIRKHPKAQPHAKTRPDSINRLPLKTSF